MALRGRKPKTSLEWFRYDSFTLQDTKIRKVLRKHGPAASAIFTELLAMVYRHKGCYLPFDEDVIEAVADNLYETDTGRISTIIDDLISAGLFDRSLYENQSILTSKRIQTEFLSMMLCLKRTSTIPSEFLLLNEEEIKQFQKSPYFLPQTTEENRISSSNFGRNSNLFPNQQNQTQFLPRTRQDKTRQDSTPLTPPQPVEENQPEPSAPSATAETHTDTLTGTETGENPENGTDDEPETEKSDSDPLAPSLTADHPFPGKTNQGESSGDSTANFGDSGDSADSDPVWGIVTLWNDVFAGTGFTYRKKFVSENLRASISARLCLETPFWFRKVFEYARAETLGKGLNSYQFNWSLPKLFKKSETFDQLKLKSSLLSKKTPAAVCGLSDPDSYASADQWRNFNVGR